MEEIILFVKNIHKLLQSTGQKYTRSHDHLFVSLLHTDLVTTNNKSRQLSHLFLIVIYPDSQIFSKMKGRIFVDAHT